MITLCALQHSLASFWIQTNIKISRDSGDLQANVLGPEKLAPINTLPYTIGAGRQGHWTSRVALPQICFDDPAAIPRGDRWPRFSTLHPALPTTL